MFVAYQVCILLSIASAASLDASAPVTQPATEPGVVRMEGFVKAMRFSDADKTDRVTRLTSDYLRSLQHVLDQRARTLAQAGEAEKSPEVDQQVTEAWRVCRALSVALRDAYVTQLNALMTPAQVERVKDGLTRDAFHQTLQVYDEMVPGMTYAQRAHVVALLHEMRENAMLEIDARPQEQWVHKYRGIINNYIAAQGHDFKALSQAFEARQSKPRQ
jgi:hypothetical protein